MADSFTAGVATTAGTGAKGPSLSSTITVTMGVAASSGGAPGAALDLGEVDVPMGCAHRRAIAYGGDLVEV